MKQLVIIGARGWGREVYGTCMRAIPWFRDGSMCVKGFLDDNEHAMDGQMGTYPPILGPVETYKIEKDDVFFCALGDPEWRRKYAEIILAKGGEFISIIHPGASISNSCRIGKGVMIANWCFVSENVKVGDFTFLHAFSDVGHDAEIGAYCSVEAYSFFGGGSKLGDGSVMHVRSSILPHKSVGANCSMSILSRLLLQEQ